MKKIDKLSAIILVFVLLFSLSGCGCEHEWQEATCLSPKTCVHCGKTEGEIIDHEYVKATCVRPQFCKMCGQERGESLGHSYSNGYCFRCDEKDPNYIDLNNFGFNNMYGMNTWIRIESYNLSEGYVCCGGWYGAWSFKINYNSYQVEQLSYDDIKTGNVEPEPGGNIVFRSISNDSIDGERGNWTIFERVVNYDNDALILKTKLSGDERWLVPSELLDFSTAYEIEAKDETQIKIYFK